ncbi:MULTISPECIES: WXG100 family type VII secretion target [Corynebacterium]|uniref:ESAT-6-like protein n=2 Tax=Corynebacterium TaxID=1716 RepID=A0ABD4TRG5_9CORY|nr:MULTISPECIES: WXG100 family type VII secretion target [Corynebacterium]MCO6393856.1 WXG100 family type VII secretion target [Corynebacterium lipophilum]MCQ4606874.1 WXG100 family type VII secretion target [Corynebacterium pseudogenitalium]MCQ4609607.1 WXG100 family type VII secretion target [Corynebacterium sp. CCUG 61414]MCQ4611516.1 WXG100 family type VII secretion target [Corynebacterium sp. CCUG 51687]MCQ4613936.1 WXG100 family type VII secretion target [Corynebacterium pseudogenitalium
MQIKYDFAQIANAAEDMRSSATRITSQLNELKQIIQPMAQTWEGTAASAYQAHQAKWDQAAEDLNTILNQIASTVEDGNSTMLAVNNAAANSWG